MLDSMPPQPRVDFQKLVSRISDQFELQNTIEVLPKARKALSEPANEYTDHVEQEISEDNISIEFLEDSLRKVLENALDIAKELGLEEIDEHVIQESMNRYCPYLFWC